MQGSLNVKAEDVLHLATLKEVLGAFRHEMSQPLNAIIMAAQIVQLRLDRTGLPGEEKEFLAQRLELISAQVKRANEILQDIRTIANQGRVTKDTANLRSLVDEIRILMAQQLIFRGIEVVQERMECELPISRDDIAVYEGIIIQGFACARETLQAIEAWHSEKSLSYKKTVRVNLMDTAKGAALDLTWDRGDSAAGELMIDPNSLAGLAAAQSILESAGGSMTIEQDAVNIRFVAKA